MNILTSLKSYQSINLQSRTGEVKKIEYDTYVTTKEDREKRVKRTREQMEDSPPTLVRTPRNKGKFGGRSQPKPSEKRPKKPYYDADDQVALGKMTKL